MSRTRTRSYDSGSKWATVSSDEQSPEAQPGNPWNCEARTMPGTKNSTARKGGKKNSTPVNWNKPTTKKQKQQRARLLQGAQMNQSLPSRQPRIENQIGSAVRVRVPTVGMSDLIQHRITWVAGTVLVGNGTIGSANAVFMANQAASEGYDAGSGGGFWIPFAPADADVGATYAAAIMKLYRRVRIRRAAVHFRTIQSSTTNNLVVAVAPCRGPPGAAEIAGLSTTPNVVQSLQNLMSVSGMQSCDSFENMSLDLTPYIAGGAGANQNEFAIANTIAQSADPGQVLDPIGVVPCAFQVAGNSTVTALQGSVTHNIVCEMVCDLLDFVGAVPVIDPSAFVAGKAAGLCRRHARSIETKEERRGRLMSELSALVRDDKGKRDISSSPVRNP
jgi:hypothetical protein